MPSPQPRAPWAARRPRSLREATLWGREQGKLDAFLREFLDSFYLEPDPTARGAMLAEEPPLLEDEKANAYLEAVAEHLAFRHRLAVPEWAQDEARFLRRPFFPAGLESLKATFLVESPTADIASIADAESALALIEAFYPASRIPPKVRFGVEEIMERVRARRAVAP